MFPLSVAFTTRTRVTFATVLHARGRPDLFLRSTDLVSLILFTSLSSADRVHGFSVYLPFIRPTGAVSLFQHELFTDEFVSKCKWHFVKIYTAELIRRYLTLW